MNLTKRSKKKHKRSVSQAIIWPIIFKDLTNKNKSQVSLVM